MSAFLLGESRLVDCAGVSVHGIHYEVCRYEADPRRIKLSCFGLMFMVEKEVFILKSIFYRMQRTGIQVGTAFWL